MKRYWVIVGLLVIGLFFSCSNSSDKQSQEVAEEQIIDESTAEVYVVEKTAYQREVEKFGNDANFPANIQYERTREVSRSIPPVFEQIIRDYGDYFLTEFISPSGPQGEDEIVYYITFNKSGSQVDLERVKVLNDYSKAWDEFITDRDIRIRYSYQPLLKDEEGNMSLRGDPFISYQHLAIREDGSIFRNYCDLVDGDYLDVLESYAVMPEEYISIENEGVKIAKEISKLDNANGYLEANNGRVKMAVFRKNDGFNISLVQRTESDMCCDYFQTHAVKFSNNELCEPNEITATVFPELDSSAFFQEVSDYTKFKDLVSFNYQIPQIGTSMEIVPEFCSCALEEMGISKPPLVNSITLKWNKEEGIFEL